MRRITAGPKKKKKEGGKKKKKKEERERADIALSLLVPSSLVVRSDLSNAAGKRR